MTEHIVDRASLQLVLKKLKKLRNWCTRHKCDPWATRQALLFVVELDKHEALDAGIKPEALAAFDIQVIEKTKEWLKEQK